MKLFNPSGPKKEVRAWRANLHIRKKTTFEHHSFAHVIMHDISKPDYKFASF
jgi:hypothetical protein